ncbi:hypothetical protein FCJ57_02790 [Burkholderia diffusa]|nr:MULTISPECIES: hypothetical protein [Burkholderia cepacia complex]NTY35351.1 hypothetical protein [Burkholderia diffusa]
MKYKQLGRTGLYVSELCLGTMTLGGNADAGMWKAIGAVDVALTEEELARLDAVSAFPRCYPGWMIDRQDASRRPLPFRPVASN